MKAIIVLAGLLAAGSFALAQGDVPSVSSPGGKAPKKGAAPAKGDAAAAKIEGIEIARAKGFLGIQVANGGFKLSFYDEKKKPVAADLPRAMLRWDPKGKTGQERAVLTGSNGATFLASDKFVRPPYNFKLFITLTKEGSEEPAESYVVDFRQ